MTEPLDFSSAGRIERLRWRCNVLRRIRQFFFERDFFEVETPLLSRDTVVDRYLEPVRALVATPGQHTPVFLQTSPEFAMKRLLCEGAKAIFQIGKAFRDGEYGPRHNPEFTMLEWYRVGDDYDAGQDLLDEFSQQLLAAPPAARLTYGALFEQLVQINPHTAELAELQQAASAWADKPETLDRDGCLNLLMSEIVEPKLTEIPAVIISDWPHSQAALARVRQIDGDEGNAGNGRRYQVAERYELYVRGLELANGYHELCDPEELADRNRRVNELRQRDARDCLPSNSRLLEAMANPGMPACCGVAVGIDRLLMALAGTSHFKDVVPFDFSQA